MMYKMCSHIKTLGVVVVLVMSSCLQAMDAPAVEAGYFDQVKTALSNSGEALSNNIELVHLARSLFSIPYIMTVDSNDPAIIKSTALLASCSPNFKLIYERLAVCPPGYRKLYNLYHEPKLFCYLLATAYDVMRFMGATDIALKNEMQQGKMRGFKINQVIQLLVEICLRGFALASNDQNPQGNGQQSSLALCAAECADWVELWRLLSRYSTYMNVSKVEANFNVSIKKEEDFSDNRAVHVEGSIDPVDHDEIDVSVSEVIAQLQDECIAPAA
ncbi:hypothetical protein JST56_05730 [Candidatus Dependentiae bacterium]|nr:hypothetical protein [Candidatus Dependentiae bacterium]